MELQVITRYRFEGKEFNTLKEVQTYVENEIGKILDAGDFRMVGRYALAIFNSIVKNKERLRALLKVEYVDESESEIQPIVSNILDMKL